jgi:hypothetical protein
MLRPISIVWMTEFLNYDNAQSYIISFWWIYIYMYTRGGSRISSWGGGEAHLKKLRRAEGGANIFGVFRVKNHDFTPKNLIFSDCGGRRENFWGISCEKSRFYDKKILFFPILEEARAGCGPLDPPLYTVYKTLTRKIKMQNTYGYYDNIQVRGRHDSLPLNKTTHYLKRWMTTSTRTRTLQWHGKCMLVWL